MNVSTSQAMLTGLDFRKWLRLVTPVLNSKYITLIFRLIIGSIFIGAGLSKLYDPTGFITAVSSYDVLSNSLRDFLISVLPWLELVIGSYLLLGILLKVASLISMVMLGSFIAAIGINLYRGVAVECGCFGSIGLNMGVGHLIADFFLLFMTSKILFAEGRFLAVDSWLLSLKTDRKTTVVPEVTGTSNSN